MQSVELLLMHQLSGAAAWVGPGLTWPPGKAWLFHGMASPSRTFPVPATSTLSLEHPSLVRGCASAGDPLCAPHQRAREAGDHPAGGLWSGDPGV